MKTYIGIDNGTSGSIGIIMPTGVAHYFKMPTKKVRDYTKKEKNVSRVDVHSLINLLKTHIVGERIALLERPMINSGRFNATVSAARALEATLIVLESAQIKYEFVDSKEWQKIYLPPQPEKKEDRKKGLERTKEIKRQSLEKGIEMFPGCTWEISSQGDADGLLIAALAREKDKKTTLHK